MKNNEVIHLNADLPIINANYHSSEKDRLDAFKTFQETGSISETAKRHGYSFQTVNEWARKGNWKRIIKESGLSFIDFKKNEAKSIEKKIEKIIEESEYEELVENINLPSSVRNALSSDSVSDSELISLASSTYYFNQYGVIKSLVRKVEDALIDKNIAIRSWGDVIKTITLINSMTDKLRESLIKAGFNTEEIDNETKELEKMVYAETVFNPDLIDKDENKKIESEENNLEESKTEFDFDFSDGFIEEDDF